jgi:hypothetical protein
LGSAEVLPHLRPGLLNGPYLTFDLGLPGKVLDEVFTKLGGVLDQITIEILLMQDLIQGSKILFTKITFRNLFKSTIGH